MVANERMKGIHDDLEHTADDLEEIARGLAGHAVYLSHSIHTQDARDVKARISGLNTSINDLRQVADSIDT